MAEPGLKWVHCRLWRPEWTGLWTPGGGEQSTLWIRLSVLGSWVHHASCWTVIGSWPGGERSRYLEASVSEMLWGKGWQEIVKGLPKVGSIF